MALMHFCVSQVSRCTMHSGRPSYHHIFYDPLLGENSETFVDCWKGCQCSTCLLSSVGADTPFCSVIIVGSHLVAIERTFQQKTVDEHDSPFKKTKRISVRLPLCVRVCFRWWIIWCGFSTFLFLLPTSCPLPSSWRSAPKLSVLSFFTWRL